MRFLTGAAVVLAVASAVGTLPPAEAHTAEGTTEAVAADAATTRAVAADEVASTVTVANTVVYREKSEGYDCFRIPAVVKADNGDLLAFAEGRNGGDRFCGDLGDIDLVVKRSTDDGRTWGPLEVVIEGHGDTKGNPTPIVVPGTGRIVLLSVMQCHRNPACGRIPRVSISEDHGSTWSTPRVLTEQLGFDGAPRWLATGPSHGLVLTRGPHAGRLVAGMSYTIGDRGHGSIVYSDDRGDTWRRGAVGAGGPGLNPQEISLVELVDGRVYAAARNDANSGDKCLDGGRRNRAYAISPDSGETFSAGFAFEEDLVTPVVQGSAVRMSATDRGAGHNRVLFAAPSTCDRRKQLVLHSSFDEGGNWTPKSAGFPVWDQDAAYSDLVPLGASSVGVLYEAGPASNANASIRWSRVTEDDLGAPVCGSGYRVIDSERLADSAGTVYLAYDARTGANCVATTKATSVGRASPTSAFLEVQGGARRTDAGSFGHFAGPVTAVAAGKCVQWGGNVGSATYESRFEHCG
ncbi:sialidase family protein [Saccharothrix australiensis]|uniref:exo-alpha-sialidase n=1 Tax=Saccharothrix australiensis TaxID=2072 RepID=A0A495W259_9PSEU|nr:sialidase family protein [Saccharothrix australiensis]RKT55484.1 sialidase-1 [Saccharothrix australiensis]